MPAKRIVAEVEAHHNVTDFRPYKIRFADKGSKNANLIHMIVTAIKKEAEWNGWFCEIEFATPKQIKELVTKLIESAPSKGMVKGAIICRNDDVVNLHGDDTTIGLIVFVDKGDNNFGFLMHYADSNSITEDEFAEYGDKYETKWVSLC